MTKAKRGKPRPVRYDHPWWKEQADYYGQRAKAAAVMMESAELARRLWPWQDSKPNPGLQAELLRACGCTAKDFPMEWISAWLFPPNIPTAKLCRSIQPRDRIVSSRAVELAEFRNRLEAYMAGLSTEETKLLVAADAAPEDSHWVADMDKRIAPLVPSWIENVGLSECLVRLQEATGGLEGKHDLLDIFAGNPTAQTVGPARAYASRQASQHRPVPLCGLAGFHPEVLVREDGKVIPSAMLCESDTRRWARIIRLLDLARECIRDPRRPTKSATPLADLLSWDGELKEVIAAREQQRHDPARKLPDAILRGKVKQLKGLTPEQRAAMLALLSR